MRTEIHLDKWDIQKIIAEKFSVLPEKVLVDCYMKDIGYVLNEDKDKDKEPDMRVIIVTKDDEAYDY